MAETRKRRPVPEPFEDMPDSRRLLLVGVVPVAFGLFAGAFLSPMPVIGQLPVFYAAWQVVATVGGFYAGLEHRSYPEAILRGFTAGLGYGAAILAVRVLFGGDDHGLLGTDPALLPFITALGGAVLGVIGATVRRRREG